LNRAIELGSVRGERISPRKFLVPVAEEVYLRSHWELLRDLRWSLRNERNIRLAVLFGSVSRGTESPDSDVDILVGAVDSSPSRLGSFGGRLEDQLNRPVQVVALEDASESPELMESVLDDGRVLIDRDRRWERLKQAAGTARSAESEWADLIRNQSDGD